MPVGLKVVNDQLNKSDAEVVINPRLLHLLVLT